MSPIELFALGSTLGRWEDGEKGPIPHPTYYDFSGYLLGLPGRPTWLPYHPFTCSP